MKSEQPNASRWSANVDLRADGIGYSFRDPSPHSLPSLWARVPNLVTDAVQEWIATTAITSGSVYTILQSDAERMVLTAMINDATALLSHVDSLDGRSAAHCARATYEHLINGLDLAQSPRNTAQRYSEHRAITEREVAARRWHLPHLGKQDRKKEEKRLDRLARESKRDAETSLLKYGKRFRHGWAEGTLYERAKNYGYDADYAGYRILSAVIHGSSGAMAGTTRTVKGMPLYRIGPDLDLAATAFNEGLRNALHYFEELEKRFARPETRALVDVTQKLLDNIGAVRAELRRVDKELWPVNPRLPPVAVVAIYKGGVERWFIFNDHVESLTPAETPTTHPDLGSVRDLAAQHGWDGGGGRPVTAMVEGVVATPKRNAAPFPAASIMVPLE